MEEPKEVTIKIKGEDKSASFKHLVYELMECSSADPTLKALVEQAKHEFVCEIDSVTVIIKMTL